MIRILPQSSATVVASVRSGEILTVVDGPIVSDDDVWWEVITGAVSGYIGIGDRLVQTGFGSDACDESDNRLTLGQSEFAAEGGTTSLTLRVSEECETNTWRTFRSVPWLHVQGVSTGASNAMLTVRVEPSSLSLTRTGFIAVAGQLVSVTQTGAEATVTVSPTTWAPAAGGGSQAVTVTSSAVDREWSASTTASWLTVSPSSGIGTGTVVLAAAPTDSASPRTATAQVAGQTVTVTQAAGVRAPVVSPQTWVPEAAGDTLTADVTWTVPAGPSVWEVVVESSAPWLTIVDPSTGLTRPTVTLRGTGAVVPVTIVAAPATGPQSRTAALRILSGSEATLTVTQAGRPVSFAVSPDVWSVSGVGGVQTLSIQSSVDDAPWTALASAPWLTVDPLAGTGDGVLRVTAAATTTAQPRTATVTVGGRTVTVSQSGGVPVFSFSPERFAAEGGWQQTTLLSSLGDAPWTATSSDPWLTVSPNAGVGSQVVTLTASPQADFGPSRKTTVTIEGRRFSVTQLGRIEPGPPQQLTAVLTGSRVLFDWNSPDEGGVPEAYLLEYGFAPGRTDGALLNVGGARQFAVDVPPGRFYVRVKAQNVHGIGPASNEVEIRVGQPGAAPARPQAFTASAAGSRVSLAWTRPAGGSSATGYQLEAGTSPGLSNLASLTLGPETQFHADGIAAGLYFLRVRAINAFGTSEPSEEAVLAVGGVAAPPLRPSGLLARVGGSTVAFSWNAPASGGVPTGYTLEAGTEPGLSNIVAFPLGAATAFLVEGVPPGVYFVRVRASNPLGVSAPSNEVVLSVGAVDRSAGRAATDPEPIDSGPPPGPPVNVRGVVASNTLNVGWDPPMAQSAVSDYRVEFATTATGPALWTRTTGGRPNLVVSDLPAGHFFARVVALRGIVASDPSAALMVVVPE
jgi:hypothetical protein